MKSFSTQLIRQAMGRPDFTGGDFRLPPRSRWEVGSSQEVHQTVQPQFTCEKGKYTFQRLF